MSIKKTEKHKKARRPGQGRKTIYAGALVKITLRVPQYQVEHIDKVAVKAGGQSAAARIIFDRDIAIFKKILTFDINAPFDPNDFIPVIPPKKPKDKGS